MRIVFAGLIVAGLIPLLLALRANRTTSLFHALVWTTIAWVAWGFALVVGEPDRAGMEPSRYVALCLTGCAGVAVLGARRPHVVAWNFVVLGLFAVMVLPLLESLIRGTHESEGLRVFFLAATIAVGLLNYLPTRLAPAAFLLSLVCAGEVALHCAAAWLPGVGETTAFPMLLMAVPWIAWICLREGRRDRSEFDRLWLDFRDRWGLLWSQRVREQFNQSAQHAGWPIKLYWQGLASDNAERDLTAPDQEKMLETLRAVLQRFLAQST